MKLIKFSYAEHVGTNRQWILENLVLGDRNLLVGKNSSGKSRALSVIKALAAVITGRAAGVAPGTFQATFAGPDGEYFYELAGDDAGVFREYLSINKVVKLIRNSEGVGEIDAVELKRKIGFQSPREVVAAVAKRDTLQHPFLEPLHAWGDSVRHYLFGSALGRESFAIFSPEGAKVDVRDQNQVVAILHEGIKKYKEAFKRAIVSDLQAVGYDVTDVSYGAQINIPNGAPAQLKGLLVQEKSLPGLTDQLGMSQGMYRVVAMLIHANFAKFSDLPICLIIDDIGEGLDYARSCKLIDQLRAKVAGSNAQLIMSTNDKFVMNGIPLEEWSILHREGSLVTVKNINNSREEFEEFKFTGLGNFAFFEIDSENQKYH